MFKYLLIGILVTVAAAKAATTVQAKPTTNLKSSTKREIGDARVLSSPFASFPLGVTDTLGAGVLTNLAYPGSLGNVYANSDEVYYGGPGYYGYPRYAAGYSNYRNYRNYDGYDGSLIPGYYNRYYGGYPYNHYRGLYGSTAWPGSLYYNSRIADPYNYYD